MSRIHDALKKAQQERAAGLPADEALPIGSEAEAPARHAEVAAVRELPPPAETFGWPTSLAALAEHCAHPKWTPDSKITMIFDSLDHVPGGEELRTLRSRLYQIRDQRALKTVLITSAVPAEGKTFLTASLAHTIVRQHERSALIIDADLRKSQLHNALGAPGEPGLTDYLAGKADEYAVVQQGPRENLFFIPGGKQMENPAELLSNGRLQVMLERLTPLFDWVLIDTPPVVPVSDASMLAKFADGILLVVRAESTPFDLAQKAREEFRDRHLLGVVLNRAKHEGGYGYYYHYYSTGSKADSKKRKR
jgi:capsular exopolysaccharide synthesis family protein